MELFIVACLLIWLWALVSVCSRRDIDIHNKVSWVVTILVLNALGALLYLVACPKQEPTPASTCGARPDTIPESPEGRAWLASTMETEARDSTTEQQAGDRTS